MDRAPEDEDWPIDSCCAAEEVPQQRVPLQAEPHAIGGACCSAAKMDRAPEDGNAQELPQQSITTDEEAHAVAASFSTADWMLFYVKVMR